MATFGTAGDSNTHWVFQLHSATDFDVAIDLRSPQGGTASLYRIAILVNGPAASLVQRVSFLNNTPSPQYIRVPFTAADLAPDNYFRIVCTAFRPINQAATWRWTTALFQSDGQGNRRRCGILPAESPFEDQALAAGGITDPAGAQGRPFGDSKYSTRMMTFDVSPPGMPNPGVTQPVPPTLGPIIPPGDGAGRRAAAPRNAVRRRRQ